MPFSSLLKRNFVYFLNVLGVTFLKIVSHVKLASVYYAIYACNLCYFLLHLLWVWKCTLQNLYINPITSRGDMGSRWVCGHFYIHIKYHKQPCTSIMSWSEWYSAGPNIFRAFPTARNPSSGVKDRYEWSIANAVTFAEIILRFSKDIKDCGQYIELMWAMAIPVNGNTSEVKLFRKWKKHLWTKCPV